MPESIFKGSLPNWLNYALTFTGITGLTGVILLYMYQCKLIYPASYPEGSRVEVEFINTVTQPKTLTLNIKRWQCLLILACLTLRKTLKQKTAST
jgi:hypothetical protein